MDGWLETGYWVIHTESTTDIGKHGYMDKGLMILKNRLLIGMERLALAMARQAMDH